MVTLAQWLLRLGTYVAYISIPWPPAISFAEPLCSLALLARLPPLTLSIMDWKSSDIARQYKAAESMTGPFALCLIRQSGIDKVDGTQDLVVLDNACGTGVLTSLLYEHIPAAAKPRLQVVCGDFASGMVESVKERIAQSGWTNATAKIMDAQVRHLPRQRYDTRSGRATRGRIRASHVRMSHGDFNSALSY